MGMEGEDGFGYTEAFGSGGRGGDVGTRAFQENKPGIVGCGVVRSVREVIGCYGLEESFPEEDDYFPATYQP